jgi:hypothetical protein
MIHQRLYALLAFLLSRLRGRVAQNVVANYAAVNNNDWTGLRGVCAGGIWLAGYGNNAAATTFGWGGGQNHKLTLGHSGYRKPSCHLQSAIGAGTATQSSAIGVMGFTLSQRNAAVLWCALVYLGLILPDNYITVFRHWRKSIAFHTLQVGKVEERTVPPGWNSSFL